MDGVALAIQIIQELDTSRCKLFTLNPSKQFQTAANDHQQQRTWWLKSSWTIAPSPQLGCRLGCHGCKTHGQPQESQVAASKMCSAAPPLRHIGCTHAIFSSQFRGNQRGCVWAEAGCSSSSDGRTINEVWEEKPCWIHTTFRCFWFLLRMLDTSVCICYQESTRGCKSQPWSSQKSSEPAPPKISTMERIEKWPCWTGQSHS